MLRTPIRGFPKIKVPASGVNIIRILVFGGSAMGSLFWETTSTTIFLLFLTGMEG